ncbi:hypothetical protein DACRYDRAFT_95882 [Dacryopinax primogenitus]|uniref:UBR-type domain-containing protein n=1 Tax=Dacryopinax primogenitus (strain DJM 731) TaxID=1858805 RepID=M5FV48_DACPD|nr:uncharacterized protein DACRYDRAFT_95882 [Dacryopinax primogenitus]EJT99469.1 hypothetical protein DACRYDRAFT_95882 [Dacryopinax primogenitus]
MPSLQDLVNEQRALEEEASQALPWSFSECTYNKGYIRQPVFLCLTCQSPHGICAACSIACHGDHEQVELFPKRAFRCDCPTSSLSHQCTLHQTLMPPNEKNTYNQNYHNKFCRCGRQYLPSEERETMIQCLACEDWYHESCLNLRERPPPRSEAPPRHSKADDDADSDTSDLPPGLLSEDEYDSMICADCVRKSPVLQRWARTSGVKLVVRDKSEAWRVAPSESPRDTVKEETIDVGSTEQTSAETDAVEDKGAVKPEQGLSGSSGTKRAADDELQEERPLKKPRSLCHAPLQSALSRCVYSPDNDNPALESAGDVFLMDGFRLRWCQCPDCLPDFGDQQYLLREEDTYEPPDDPEAHMSIEELGMRMLDRLPRDRVIDGIHAYNQLRDRLTTFLRPFTQENKEVRQEDIESFFSELRAGR